MQSQQTPAYNPTALSIQKEAVIGPLVCSIAASVRGTILPSNPNDRRLGLILLIMFLVGIALACSEVVRWWKARKEGPPPLSKMLKQEERELDRAVNETTRILSSHPQARPA